MQSKIRGVTYDERVPLASKDLDRVDSDGLVVHAVSLNDSHVVAVDREGVVGVARQRNKAEAVTAALGDVEHRELSISSVGARSAALAVDERRVRRGAVKTC